ncbi:hypothetical protein ACFO3D_18055 [Virgibacillus kekensis]|uniref:Uncharacterized protein n=1 Tax=Virgibacillus kekensis TaxID=202261 RepID=A0ABV9DMU8_9BACI
MKLAIILIIIVSLIGLVLTVREMGRSDEGYYKASKKNVTSLTMIYVVAILGSLIALAVFIVKTV